MKNEFKTDAGTIINGADAKAGTTTTVAGATATTILGACHGHG